LDQLYSRTETPEARDAASAVPEAAVGGGADGIMSALPRRRPHRRSSLRAGSGGAEAPAAVAGGAAVQAVAVAEEPAPRHLRAVSGAVPGPPASRRSRHRRTLPPPREPAPGIGRLALDGMVESVKLPWRVAAEVARQAAGAIPGTLRR
jgi:hypothetical protein